MSEGPQSYQPFHTSTEVNPKHCILAKDIYDPFHKSTEISPKDCILIGNQYIFLLGCLTIQLSSSRIKMRCKSVQSKFLKKN
uniref:Uncharacterized protein n=1 Tax=Arundo donax TaxID=35708 RepID=A0A0A9EFZ3_ARUDO